MTAINVYIGADCVRVISDGVFVGLDGRVLYTGNKITIASHLNAVIGVRGSTISHTVARSLPLPTANSYDELRALLPDYIRNLFANDPGIRAVRTHHGNNVLDTEFIVAGWSETKGPSAWILATANHNAAYGLPAWKPADVVGGYLIASSTPEIEAKFGRAQFELTDQFAIDLVVAQRESRLKGIDCKGATVDYVAVGGFVQLTSIYRERIETRILHRFTDKVGEPITP